MPGAEARSLARLQARLFQLITAPESVEKTLAAEGLGPPDLEAIVVGDARASAIERLDVYANMYFFRIRDVLAEYFPKLRGVLGEAAFHDLVTDYLVAHPPRHPSLRNVGQALPAFLGAPARSALRESWLAELAALEWARLDVFDRADVVPLGREALASLAPEAFAELPLALVPAHEVVATRHAVEETWRALEAGSPAVAPPVAGPAHALLVWRRDVTVHHRSLDETEAPALARARGGCTFGALCAELGRHRPEDEAARLAAGFLGRWIADELLAG